MAEDYESMTVAQLKELLKEQGLPVSGKKGELVARLMESEGAEAPTVEEDAPVASEDSWDDDEDWDGEDEDVYVVKQKPVLDEETKEALSLRAAQKKKTPSFRNRVVPLQATCSVRLASPSRNGQQTTTELQVPRFPCPHRSRESGRCSLPSPVWI